MGDVFDTPPNGFMRAGRAAAGWLIPAPSPQDRKLRALEEQNRRLAERLERLAQAVRDREAEEECTTETQRHKEDEERNAPQRHRDTKKMKRGMHHRDTETQRR
ncbi:MAG: hypothetical protein AB1646_23900 [Thermodesulfobacteriota bacterium]